MICRVSKWLLDHPMHIIKHNMTSNSNSNISNNNSSNNTTINTNKLITITITVTTTIIIKQIPLIPSWPPIMGLLYTLYLDLLNVNT